jgi:acetyl esterase/lipase
MKLFMLVAGLVLASVRANAQTNIWQPSAGHTQVLIWPGTVPDAHRPPGPEYMKLETNHLVAGKEWTWVCNVSQPTMTFYPPKGSNTGVAVVVFPGGGYQALAIDLEGTEICEWLASKGITGVLLKYRVPSHREGPYGEAPMALEDAQRTLSLVRFHATEWHINPHKIGVMGFSAGGHMVAATSTHYGRRSYRHIDPADNESCRPDFAVALYPGHLWDEDTPFKLNPNVPVTINTPPTFIVQAEDDPVDNVNNSLIYYGALQKAKVPAEIHLFPNGGHGFGIRRTKLPITGWTQLMETWLAAIGMTSSS